MSKFNTALRYYDKQQRLARIILDRKIDVKPGRAATDMDKVIYLPFPKTPKGHVCCRMYLDHEIAHIKHTTLKRNVFGADTVKGGLLNVFEDIRIDNISRNGFTGVAENQLKGNSYIFEHMQERERKYPGSISNLAKLSLDLCFAQFPWYKPITKEFHVIKDLLADVYEAKRTEDLIPVVEEAFLRIKEFEEEEKEKEKKKQEEGKPQEPTHAQEGSAGEGVSSKQEQAEQKQEGKEQGPSVQPEKEKRKVNERSETLDDRRKWLDGSIHDKIEILKESIEDSTDKLITSSMLEAQGMCVIRENGNPVKPDKSLIQLCNKRQRILAKYMQSLALEGTLTEQEKGVGIDRSQVHALASGKVNIFTEDYFDEGIGGACALLLDFSGSMSDFVSNGSLKSLEKEAKSLAIICQRIGVDCIVAGFVDVGSTSQIHVLKNFNDDANFCNMCIKPLGGTPIGPAIIWAVYELEKTNKDMKTIFVFTDGAENVGKFGNNEIDKFHLNQIYGTKRRLLSAVHGVSLARRNGQEVFVFEYSKSKEKEYANSWNWHDKEHVKIVNNLSSAKFTEALSEMLLKRKALKNKERRKE